MGIFNDKRKFKPKKKTEKSNQPYNTGNFNQQTNDFDIDKKND